MRALLGTFVEISADGIDVLPLADAIEAAFQAVVRVHELMSLQASDSDLSRINRDAWRAPVEVHPWTARTLAWALTIHRSTGGLFDCAVGHELFGRGLRPGCGLEQAEAGSLTDLALSGNRVWLKRRIGLDLGGIAKGFAVDRAIATLRARGVRQAVVNAGGDLRVMGPAAELVHLRDSCTNVVRFAGALRNGAIATSSGSELVRRRAPRTVVRGGTWSVVAPRCVVADALTKALAQGDDANPPWLAHFGATLPSPPRHLYAT